MQLYNKHDLRSSQAHNATYVFLLKVRVPQMLMDCENECELLNRSKALEEARGIQDRCDSYVMTWSYFILIVFTGDKFYSSEQ